MSFRFAIPLARPMPIDNRLLAQLTRVAHDAPKSLASEAECEWLLSAIGPLLDELSKRRAFMDGMGVTLSADNVIQLPGAR